MPNRVQYYERLGEELNRIRRGGSFAVLYLDLDNFKNVIRFDSRDILADTSELEYGVINRVYAKGFHCDTIPKTAGIGQDIRKLHDSFQCGETSREIISWELGHKFFINEDFDPQRARRDLLDRLLQLVFLER